MVLRSAGESVVDYGSRRVVGIAVSTWYCGLLESKVKFVLFNDATGTH